MIRQYLRIIQIVALLLWLSQAKSVACGRTADSLVLVKLNQSTNGNGWITKRRFNEPINTWYGIALDINGCVIQINLNNNNLKGSLPTEIGNLGALSRLFLFSNELSGELPTSLGNLTELLELNVEGNFFTGSIPSTLGNLNKLGMLVLGDNALTGHVPEGINFLDNLILLDLSRNKLSGGISNNIFRLSKLQTLDYSENEMSGEIPATISSMNALRNLYLNNNHFFGEPPAVMSQLLNMTNLWLNDNAFTGRVPDLTQSPLISLRIENNFFNSIPDFSVVKTFGRVDPGGLVMYNNYFTFEDLIPLLSLPRFVNWNFKPQRPVSVDSIQYVQYGSNYAIRLYTDPGISDNNYKWFKDTSKLTISNQNFFQIIQLDEKQEGYYYGSFVNQLFPDFQIDIPYIRIVGFNPSKCDSPLAGNTCDEAPSFCNTNDLHNYCGNLSISDEIKKSNFCDSTDLIENPRYLRFTAAGDSVMLEIFPMSCNEVNENGQIYKGLQAAILRSCDSTRSTSLFCSSDCVDHPFFIGGGGFVKGQEYILVIDGCKGNLCNYLVKVRQGRSYFKLLPDSLIAGEKYFCPDTSNHYYSIGPIAGATEYGWYVNDKLVSTSTDTFLKIKNFAPGSYTIGVRGFAKCDSTNLVRTTVRIFSELKADQFTSSRLFRDSVYQIRFKVIGGTRPYKLLQGKGQFDSLTGDFISDLRLCKSDYLFQIIDSNQCILTVSGRENCSCDSYAGTMPTELLTVCDGSNIVARNNNDFVRDTGDVSTFIFCSDSTKPVQSQLRINTSGIFPFDISRYKYDSIYYLVFVIGRSNGQGQIDLKHPCLSISNAQPVVFRRKSTLAAGPDQILCTPETQLRAIGNFLKVRWTLVSGPNGYSLDYPDSLETPLHLDSIGQYLFRVEGANLYCLSSDEIKVTYDTIYRPVISGVLSLCGNKETTLDAGDQLNYRWSTGDSTRNIIVKKSGTYCVSVTNSPGCEGSTCVDVKISADPVFSILGNTKLCRGSLSELSCSAEFANYKWNNGLFTKTITIDTSGTYCVTVTNSDGCSAASCVNVNLYPTSFFNRTDSACDQSVVLYNNKFYNVPGQYEIILSGANQYGCDSIFNLNLVSYPRIVLKDSVIMPDRGGSSGSITLQFGGGTGMLNFIWSNGAKTANISNLKAGTYTLTVRDSKNCIQEYTFIVRSAVGVRDIAATHDLIFFPNPLQSDHLLQWISKEKSGLWQLYVSDTRGTLVFEKKFEGIHIGEINVLEWSGVPGVYYIEARHEGGFVSHHKIIIAQP